MMLVIWNNERIKRRLKRHRKIINNTQRSKNSNSEVSKNEAIKPKHFKTISPKANNNAKIIKNKTEIRYAGHNTKDLDTKISHTSMNNYDSKEVERKIAKKAKTPNKRSTFMRNQNFSSNKILFTFIGNSEKQENNLDWNVHQDISLHTTKIW